VAVAVAARGRRARAHGARHAAERRVQEGA
jgi:hypothetical protein